MTVGFKRGFEKRTKRLPSFIREALAERLKIFVEMPHHPLLNNHALTGEWRGYRSINVTGDWRAIYQPINTDLAILVDVDTHHNLYGT